jgi:hypothetical protein
MSRLGEDIAYGWNEFWTGPIGTKIYDTVTLWWERLFFKLKEGLNEIFGLQLFVDNAQLEADRIRLGFANEQETEKFLAEQRGLINDLRAEISSKTEAQENLDPNNMSSVDYSTDIIMKQAELATVEALVAEISALNNTNSVPTTAPPMAIIQPGQARAIGTLKATGYNFEPQDAVTQIHAGERVLNSQETQTFNNLNSIQSDLVKKVEELNTSMLKAVDLLKDSVDAAKATSRSIKSLGTDAMRGVGR